jgi:two-component system cell cycle sensor histidine kinase/response regulator CckA
LLQPWGSSLRPGELLHLLEAAVDQLHDIVFITEAESIDTVGPRILFVNGAFSRATGFDPREVIGRTPNVTVGEGTERPALKRIEAGLKAGKPVHEQLQKYGKDGSSYWVDLTIIPVFDDQGKHTHWVSVQRDVTETKRLQEKLLETERLASAGMLAAGLTHEINNPLTGVTMGLEWVSELLPALARRLRSGAQTPLDQAELQAIAGDLEAADGAVSDAIEGAQRVESTLQYLSMLAGVHEESKQPLDVHNLLDAALEGLLHRSAVPGIVVRDYARVPFVVGSEAQLVHMFHSLLLNAAQALPGGGDDKNRIVIRAFEDSRRRVCVEIEDTGTGIPPEVAKRLFSPFVSSRARGLGKGLGLFMARQIVRSLAGELSYATELGRGTTFTALLPARGQQGGSIRPAERSKRALFDARILVIDHDVSTARSIRNALSPIKSMVCVSSFTAAPMVEDASFDIVFASLNASGLELHERSLRATPPPRFVFLCDATTPRELRQQAQRLGAILLDRPLERADLVNAAIVVP